MKLNERLHLVASRVTIGLLMIAPLVVLLIAATTDQVPFLADADHPIRSFLITCIFLAIVWATDEFYWRSRFRSLWFPMGILLLFSLGWTILSELYQYTLLGVTSATILIGLLILIAVATISRNSGRALKRAAEANRSTTGAATLDRANGTNDPVLEELESGIESSATLREWGHLVSIGVMIMAMFAFGLHIEEATLGKPAHVGVRWGEVPAILIVFILAEFGVHLVTKAMEVRSGVSQAAGNALAAAERALTVRRSLNDINDSLTATNISANASIKTLQSSLETLTHASESKILERVYEFRRKTALEERECWNHLARFVESWTPVGIEEGEAKPVGHFLRGFVGERNSTGSAEENTGVVRSTSGVVSCIMADSVYARGSGEWLREALENVGPNEKVVAWAVTTLLPTEFALPTLWWKSKNSAIPDRAKTLEEFVEAVSEICENRGDKLAEYKRITVFKDNGCISMREQLPEARNLDLQSVIEGNILPKTIRGLDLRKSLTAWFLPKDRIQKFEYMILDPLRKEIEEIAKNKGMEVMPGARKLEFRETVPLFSHGAFKEEEWVQHFEREHLLPSLARNVAAQLFSVPTSIGKGSNPSQEENLILLLAVNDALLEDKVNEDGRTVRDVVEGLGFISILDWYSSRMHYSKANALCAIVSDDSIAKTLCLEWDGQRWPTLDLLLIGKRHSADAVTPPKWLGAAISNLHMDSPECMVTIVTQGDRLKRIADEVQRLTSEAFEWSSFPQQHALTLQVAAYNSGGTSEG